jgi:hypothetical protein
MPAMAPSPPPPAPVAPDAPPPDDAGEKVALASRLADALRLPVELPGAGDTRAAETAAKLEHAMIDDFKSHVTKCWTAPPRSADAGRLKVLVRVELNPDGTLRKDPMLIQAVASAGGPALAKSAIRALEQCEPYDFLPVDNYKEWKVLDLAFSTDGIL